MNRFDNKNNTAEQILKIILGYSIYPQLSASTVPKKFQALRNSLQQKIRYFILSDLPIKLIIPAFPAKSPNTEKTLGHLPDMGDLLGLKKLNQLCKDITTVYSNGARIIICSDGRVFGDMVQVPDRHIDQYAQALLDLISFYGFDYLSVFRLENFFSTESYDQMRYILDHEYSDSIESLREIIRTNNNELKLFNGIHRFVFEDLKVISPKLSNNQRRNQAKYIAYRVILRSHAWSNLISQCFPNALRLSIHPYDIRTEKISIQLVKSNDFWATPWHNVALLDSSGYRLVKRKTAIQAGAILSYSQDHIAYYVMPDAISKVSFIPLANQFA